MSNHRTIRGLKPKLDWISYHQYATSCKSSDPKYYQQCFFTDPESGADMFIEEVRRHNEIKDHLAPHVKTTVDEIGTMLPVDLAKILQGANHRTRRCYSMLFRCTSSAILLV